MSEHKAEIYYYDIGDYLSREEKLKIITEFKSIENLPFTRLSPNEHGDWIELRNDKFSTWIPIEASKKFDASSKSFFTVYSRGCTTDRDSWVYNYSYSKLCENIKLTIDHYNHEHKLIKAGIKSEPERNSSKGSWTRDWLKALKQGKTFTEQKKFYIKAIYRPFCKQHYYFDDDLNEERGRQPNIFPTPKHKNLVICINGLGGKKEPSALISDCIVDVNSQEAGAQCFPLYWYETIEPEQKSLFAGNAQIVRHEAISNFILEHAQTKYGDNVQKEDIFYYVYGILHSKSYRKTFSADLKKMLPRIPLVSSYQKFWAFSKAGRELANLHLNYENIAPYPYVKIEGDDKKNFIVEKMKFATQNKKDVIIYNNDITISNIPSKAYEYIVNGKSAIEWIMERYAITTDTKSKITNNPNDWAVEHNSPRYILDLLLSIINVSLQSVEIINSLPEVDWEME